VRRIGKRVWAGLGDIMMKLKTYDMFIFEHLLHRLTPGKVDAD